MLLDVHDMYLAASLVSMPGVSPAAVTNERPPEVALGKGNLC
jgi:hypothetical protein